MISSAIESESYEAMFGDSAPLAKDPSAGCLNPPKLPEYSRRFGEDSCTGSLRLLLADKDDITPVLNDVDAVVFCSDALGPPVPPEVAEGILQSTPNLKHISLLSRTMNDKGYGFFATAARAAANKEVWDNNSKDR